MPISLEEFENDEKIKVELINKPEYADLKLPDGRAFKLEPVPFIFEETILKCLNKSKNEALNASELGKHVVKELYKNINSKPYEMTADPNGESSIEKILYFLSYKNKIEMRKGFSDYFYVIK